MNADADMHADYDIDRIMARAGSTVIPPEFEGQLQSLRAPVFRALIETMRSHLGVPVAGITMVAGSQLWMRTPTGLIAMPKPSHSCFFDQVVSADGPLVVEDATTDPRFAHNPYVDRDCGLRFFVGLALRTSTGVVLGALCGAAKQPMRRPDVEQLASLTLLAEASVCALEVSDHVAALDAKSALLQVTLDGIGQGVSAFDADLKLITWNARMSQLMQLPPRLLRKGLPFADYAILLAERGDYGEGDPRRIVGERMANLRTPRPHARDLVLPGGRIIEVQITPMPAGGFLATHTDVTAERHRAAGLRAATLRFEVESTVAAIANESSELRSAIAKGLDAICRILGFHRGDIFCEDGTGTQLRHTEIRYGVQGQEGEADPELARRALVEGGIIRLGFDVGAAKPDQDGQRSIALPLTISGTIHIMVLTGGAWELRDLWFGEIGVALEHHMTRVAERERLQTLKDEFISTMNHEMRTPLTILNGGLDLLQAGIYGPLPDEAAEAVGMMVENGRRLGDLVGDILDLDAIEHEALSIPLDLVAVAGPTTDAIAVLEEAARQQGVEVSVSGVQDLVACTNAMRLTQVIRHLLSNAIKFSPPGSRVLIEARPRANGVRISVADHGSGIPESIRPTMFDKFTQTDASDRRRVNGTGLGLAIVKHLVTCLRGAVSFETRLGAGTTFHIDLPVSPAAAS